MRRTTTAAVGAVLVVVLGTGAWLTLDAYDRVPGFLTLAPPIPDASPFPTAPAAVDPTAVPAVLTDLDSAVPLPGSAQVQAQVDALVADSRMGSGTSVLITDQLTGEIVAQHERETPRTPASTAKLVTAVAALSSLDPDSTLPTRVVRGGGDQIVLVGGGDMMLAEGAGDPSSVVGRAGMADLAAQAAKELQLEGVTSVSLGFDDSLFAGAKLNPGWAASDVAAGYVAPVTALAVQMGRTDPTQEYSTRYFDPSLAAAKVFAQRLNEAGITVTGSPSRTQASSDARQIGEVDSAPLSDVVAYFLDSSDNTITEVVSRLVAIGQGLPATFDGATQAVLHVVGTLGVDVDGAHLVDASGLASGSALRPTTLAQLIRLTTLAEQPNLRSVALDMPIAGLTGTLSDRYTRSPTRGLVRAKTGSLSHVTGLAGTLVDADGRMLVFVVMAAATPDGGQWPPRTAIDDFVTTLAGCGCR